MVKAKVVGKVIHVERKLSPFSKRNIKTSEEHYLAGIDNSMSFYLRVCHCPSPQSEGSDRCGIDPKIRQQNNLLNTCITA